MDKNIFNLIDFDSEDVFDESQNDNQKIYGPPSSIKYEKLNDIDASSFSEQQNKNTIYKPNSK